MEVKYHYNGETGVTGLCRAAIKCPFGGADHHYPDEASARAGYELSHSSELISTPHRRSRLSFVRDPDLLEDVRRYSNAFLNYQGLTFNSDQGLYGSEVYNVQWDEFEAHAAEVWISAGELTVYMELEGESTKLAVQKVPEDCLDERGKLTPEAKAAAIELTVELLREKRGYLFDRDNPAYGYYREMIRGLAYGRITLNGMEFHRTSSSAPEIWETEDALPEGVDEIYMRARHGVASLRVVRNGQVESIHQESYPDGNWNSFDQARFFMEANDALIAV